MDEFEFERIGLLDNRRWYDGIANMSLAVCLSRQLPEEIQAIIAKNLNDHIDHYRQLNRNNKNAVSLGSTRALGLYRASNRQRWYDKTVHTHRAYTLMSMVPDAFLSEFASRILHVAAYIEQQDNVIWNNRPTTDLKDTVQSILKTNTVDLRDRQGDIKLVANTPPLQTPGGSPGRPSRQGRFTG